MKKLSTFLLPALLLVMQSCNNGKQTNTSGGEPEGTISLSGAYALYPMALKWGEEYSKLHPKVKFDTQAGGAGKGMTDAISGTVDIGMVSRGINDEEVKKGAFGVGVVKDAVIPTINAGNPALQDLLARGITKEKLADIFIAAKIKSWAALTDNKIKDPLDAYVRSDAAGAAETFAKYLGGKQEDLQGTAVFGDPGVAQAVIQDKYGIGFNNINYVYDVKSRKPHPGLVPFPLDVNGNGTIDANENFYGDLDVLGKAIAQGVFPHPPARPLFFVTKGKPNNALVTDFLKWVLTDGQKFVEEAGYVKLSGELVQTEYKKL
jgi:phosphate transport system substrate-binding protein